MVSLIKKDHIAVGKFRYRIELATLSDIMEFVRIASKKPYSVKLIDGKDFCVSGKSLLGTSATIEWSKLYCVSDEDMYSDIRKFCID